MVRKDLQPGPGKAQGKQLGEESWEGGTPGAPGAASSSLPAQRHCRHSPEMRLQPHTCQRRNRAPSPLASPMAELSVPSREPAAGSGAQGKRWQSRESGNNWGLGMGPGPWESPCPTAAGMRTEFTLHQGIGKKVRVGGRRLVLKWSLKTIWGFSLGS